MKRVVHPARPHLIRVLLPAILIIVAATAPSYAQGGTDSASTQPNVTIEARLERARALAAAHQLNAATMELESLRNSNADDMIKNVASLMLMSICLEEGNYARAAALLEEAFAARRLRRDSSIRAYFALAGQALNGARSHLTRYRAFGINVAEPNLPGEALSDLDRRGSLLERMSAQAKEIIREEPKANESLALLEDIVGVRLSLARNEEDSAKWEIERANARRGLISGPNGVASLGNGTSAAPAAVAPSQPTAPAASVANSVSTATTAPPTNVIDGGSLNPRATRRVVPVYPQIAKNAASQGLVRVFVIVDEQGNVSEIAKTEGPPLLRGAAEDAARRWKFSPAAVDGKPVRITGFIEFNFAL